MRTSSFFAAAMLFAAGCAASVDRQPLPVTDYMEFFMRRASSSESEFEQYKISPGGVFIECGEFVRGRPEPTTQKFIPSDSLELAAVREKAAVVQRLISAENSPLPPEGKGDSMFDPGQFSLSLGEGENLVELKTTVNAVSDADTPITRSLKSFAVTLRKALKTEDCGKDDFYGIPGSS